MNYLLRTIYSRAWLAGLCLLSLSVSAQRLAALSDSPAPAPVRQVPTADQDQMQSLKNVLQELEKEYQVYFNYDAKAIENIIVPSKKVSQLVSIEEVLSTYLEHHRLGYKKLEEGYYMIYQLPTPTGLPPVKRQPIRNPSPSSQSQIISTRMTNRPLSKRQILEKTITGRVTDLSTNEPLPGVNILAKGTSSGTVTDVEGNYRLTVANEVTTLIFSSIGYETVEEQINGRNTINLALAPDIQSLSEVVVVGYSTRQMNEITGAVSVVSPTDIKNIPTHNPLQALQGRVAGMNITRDGTPGGGIRNVLIRGLNTLGNNQPLFIIDGLPSTIEKMNQLNSNDIESMQVLKDAAAASIYGSRASNGVIIVTTKKAEPGQFNIEVNSNVTIQDYYAHREVTNTEQRGRVRWRAAVNDGVDPNDEPHYNYNWNEDYDNPVLNSIQVVEFLDPDIQGGIRSADTDWFDEISRTGVLTQNYASLSNGSDVHRLFLSLGHHYNKGIVKHTDFERFTARVNSSFNLLKGKLTIGENLQITNSSQTPMGSGIGGSTERLAIRQLTIMPVYAEDGSFAGPIGAGMSDRMNPVAVADLSKLWSNDVNSLYGNMYLKFSPIENLTFNSNFGLNYNTEVQTRINPRYQTGFLTRNINNMSVEDLTENTWTWFNTLEYNVNVGKHNANMLVGTEAVKSTFNSSRAYREEFLLETEDYFEFDAGTGATNLSGNETGFNLLSYFSKLEYSYDDRYLATATLRYDGSSRFGEDNQFGFFPAFSVGWRINNEPFFKNDIDFVSQLMLRAGVGSTGNQQIDDNASLALFVPGYGLTQGFERPAGSAYDLNGADTGTLPSGVVKTQSANSNLKWESTDELNLGVNFGFLEQKITGSFDYFWRNTSDILVLPPRLAVTGDGSDRWENGATMENRGWEVNLGYNGQQGDFGYMANVSVGHFRDEITYLPAAVVRSYPGNIEKTILGQPRSSIFGYVTDGIFQNQEEVDSHATQTGKGIGRIRYRDLNNDGVINDLDQDWLGVSIPDFEYGVNVNLTYKSFSLTFFVQGVQGLELFNERKNMDLIGTGTGAGENYSIRTLDAWTPENSDSDIPALSLVDNNNEERASDYFVENASYLKLRNLRFGYILPSGIQQSLGMSRAEVYLSGMELFTIKSKNFTGPDPENPASFYPIPRSFTLGVNLSF